MSNQRNQQQPFRFWLPYWNNPTPTPRPPTPDQSRPAARSSMTPSKSPAQPQSSSQGQLRPAPSTMKPQQPPPSTARKTSPPPPASSTPSGQSPKSQPSDQRTQQQPPPSRKAAQLRPPSTPQPQPATKRDSKPSQPTQNKPKEQGAWTSASTSTGAQTQPAKPLLPSPLPASQLDSSTKNASPLKQPKPSLQESVPPAEKVTPTITQPKTKQQTTTSVQNFPSPLPASQLEVPTKNALQLKQPKPSPEESIPAAEKVSPASTLPEMKQQPPSPVQEAMPAQPASKPQPETNIQSTSQVPKMVPTQPFLQPNPETPSEAQKTIQTEPASPPQPQIKVQPAHRSQEAIPDQPTSKPMEAEKQTSAKVNPEPSFSDPLVKDIPARPAPASSAATGRSSETQTGAKEDELPMEAKMQTSQQVKPKPPSSDTLMRGIPAKPAPTSSATAQQSEIQLGAKKDDMLETKMQTSEQVNPKQSSSDSPMSHIRAKPAGTSSTTAQQSETQSGSKESEPASDIGPKQVAKSSKLSNLEQPEGAPVDKTKEKARQKQDINSMRALEPHMEISKPDATSRKPQENERKSDPEMQDKKPQGVRKEEANARVDPKLAIMVSQSGRKEDYKDKTEPKSTIAVSDSISIRTQPNTNEVTPDTTISEPEQIKSETDVIRKELALNSFKGKESRITISTIPHSSSHDQQDDFHKEIKESLLKFIEKLDIRQKQGSDEGVSIITLAGVNKGASMTIGNCKIQATSGSSEASEQKSNHRAAENPELMATVNSNLQSINNSVLHDSSCTGRNPGVHLILSSHPIEAAEIKRRIESITQRTASNILPAQKLRQETNIRRRCLRGLLLESSDDQENPQKPQHHGCRVGSNEKKKGKEDNEGTSTTNRT